MVWTIAKPLSRILVHKNVCRNFFEDTGSMFRPVHYSGFDFFSFIAARMDGKKNAPGMLVIMNIARVSRATVALSEELNPPSWVSRKVMESS